MGIYEELWQRGIECDRWKLLEMMFKRKKLQMQKKIIWMMDWSDRRKYIWLDILENLENKKIQLSAC